MNRRTVIRDLTLALGGLATVPAWANGWKAESLLMPTGLLKPTEQQMLAIVAETIIPESNTKGAISLGIPAFLEIMLKDCYEAPVTENVINGLKAADATAESQFGKSFADSDTAQKQQILLGFEKSQDTKLKDFYTLIKNLTILGYTTSEYVQTGFLNYNMAPGHYYGCVPVKK